MHKYQGKEFTATVQAPDRVELENLLAQLSRFASQNKLESIRVLDIRPDPDGGWEAVIKAHNWNPIQWLREKLGTRRRPYIMTKKEEEELLREQEIGLAREALPEGAGKPVYEEAQRLREEKARLEEELRQEKAARAARARKEAEEEFAGKSPPRAKTPEEILASLPEKERRKYEKRIKEGERAKVEAELEIWEAGIPAKKKVLHRVWNPAQQTWEFKEVEVPLTPQERLAEARIQRVGGLLIEEEVARLRQARRERGLPYRAARLAGGFAQHMAAVGMLGVAGTAQAIQPGRGGPQRAIRMHAPGLPMVVYGVRPTLGMGLPTAKGLLSLEHLRIATLPRVRQPRLRQR